MAQTVISCAQLMPFTLEWQADWPDRFRYIFINSMIQIALRLVSLYAQYRDIRSGTVEMLSGAITILVALACHVQADQQAKAERALEDLEKLKYDLKGA
jgi:hypothetical protein